jgi:D-threo-aldose 1-dehydrogenase
MRSPVEVQANVTFMSHPIPAEFWTEMKAEGLIDPASPVPAGGP